MAEDKPAGPEDVAETYDRHAADFDLARSRDLFERGWLERFAAALVPAGRVLDLGCGTGRPLATWLREHGLRVTGIDVSPAMIAIARRHEPAGDWRVGDMRTLDLAERFDGILAWDSAFHLAPSAQRALIGRLGTWLTPGGALLMTVGPEAGEAQGHVVRDAPVYHASLSIAEYARLLEDAQLRLAGFLADDPDCAGHSVLLARKAGGATLRNDTPRLPARGRR